MILCDREILEAIQDGRILIDTGTIRQNQAHPFNWKSGMSALLPSN
jgi:hypothetical protein